MKTHEPIIIAVVGLVGSGKSEATNRFVERGFARVGFNDCVYEELARQGLEITELNERAIRERMRQESGMAVMAKMSLPRVQEAIRKGNNVVIESLYSWAEYKLMRETFGEQFKVLAIYAPPELRYARLTKRKERSLSEEMAKVRDHAQIENLEQAGPIAMADWTISNIGTKAEFFHQLDLLIETAIPSALGAVVKRGGVDKLQRPLTIALMGRSGSGKGTQAQLLMPYLKKPIYIATGNLFRALARLDTVSGRKVAAQLRIGGLPPYWLAYTLWQRELVEKLVDDDQDVLFDGALRRVKEAISLDEMLAWLGRSPVIPVLIDVTREEAYRRLKARKREDDTDEIINNRLDYYETDVLPAVEYYEKQGRLIKVDGMPAPERIFKNLLAALGF